MKTNLIILAIIFAGCAPTYVPNVRNVPLFTKGGEFQASIQGGNGLDVQSAVSITNHIGLMANYSFADRERFDPDDYDDYHRHKFYEGGIGYFDNKEDWCVEIFAGYGRGEGSSLNQFLSWSPSTPAVGKYERYFIQPAIGLNKKTMNVAFVNRVSYVDFTEYTDDVIRYSVKERPVIFLEPAVVARVNFAQNFGFFTFQLGATMPAASDIYFKYRKFQTSAGFGFRIGGIKPSVVKQ
jgi:hypothetical protein